MKHLLIALSVGALAACAAKNSPIEAQAAKLDACATSETRALTPGSLSDKTFVLVEPTADFRAFGKGSGEADVVEITLNSVSTERGYKINCAVSVDGRTYFYASIPAGTYRLSALERKRGGQIVRIAGADSGKSITLDAGASYLGRPFWVVKSDRQTVTYYPAQDAANAKTAISRIAPGLKESLRSDTLK